MPKLEIRVPRQPKQEQLYQLVLHSPATWIGYGGSRGGAKSHAARAVLLLMLLDNANTRACLLRRTYDLVRENHIEPLLSQYPFMRDWYRVGDKEIRFPNNSILAFRYAENSGDVDAMIGKEYRWFVVDQAEAFTAKELNTIKSCVRWPGVPDNQSKLILTFNPGNIGHAELKRIFFDKRYNGTESPTDYEFIQAYGWDNVEWAKSALTEDGFTVKDYYSWDDLDVNEHKPEGDRRFNYFVSRTQYGRQLNALPQAMRIGWLLGRMDQFAGQYYDIFSPDRHIARCAPEPWHTRWLGIDWGFGHESACYWASQIQDNLTALYREFCEAGRSPKALAQEIVDRTPGPERTQIKHIFLSHDAFAQRTEQDTIADQMASVFRANQMPYPEIATKDIVGRATLLYDMLGPMDPEATRQNGGIAVFKPAEIVIDPSCKRLIETIPMVCRDQDHSERPLKFDGDDPYEGACYSLTYRLKKTNIPDEVAAMREFDQIADPVARWFAITAWRRKHKPTPAVIQPRIIMPWEAQR